MLRRSYAVAVASALALFVVGVLAGVSSAQTESTLYSACKPNNAVVRAAQLPRVVDQDRCPVAGRAITEDGGPGSRLPEPGTAVEVEWLTLNGTQELTVANPTGGTFVLGEVGEESAIRRSPAGGSEATVQRAAGDGCQATNYSLLSGRVYGTYAWRFNSGSTPGANDVGNVERELRLATTNVTEVQNPCGIGDGVEPRHTYEGRTAAQTDLSSDGQCGGDDGLSVTGFGDLPTTVVGATCNYTTISTGPDDLVESDLKMNKVDSAWTAEVTAGCSDRFDVQSLATHERGHTFGLNHVGMETNPDQTMNPLVSPCDTSWRSLGRGDALGLNRRYE